MKTKVQKCLQETISQTEALNNTLLSDSEKLALETHLIFLKVQKDLTQNMRQNGINDRNLKFQGNRHVFLSQDGRYLYYVGIVDSMKKANWFTSSTFERLSNII